MHGLKKVGMWSLVLMTHTFAQEVSEPQLEKLNSVARCRAHCLDAFSAYIFPSADSDSACRNKTGCLMCWENCNLFYSDFRIWGAMCGEVGMPSSVCFLGCKVACNFYGSRHKVVPADGDPEWGFLEPMNLNLDLEKGGMNVSWAPPSSLLVQERRKSFMYWVFWRGTRFSKWMYLADTSRNEFSTRNADIVTEVFDILVFAINRDGIVANQSFRNSFKRLEASNLENFHRQQEGSEQPQFTFLGSTVFVVGVTVTSFLCGLIILLAVIVLTSQARRLRRRKELYRGYAVRRKFNIRRLASSVLFSADTDIERPRKTGHVARSPALSGRASLVRINQIASLPGTPFIIRTAQKSPTARSYENISTDSEIISSARNEELGDWAAEVVSEMLRASQVYTSTPQAGLDRTLSHSPQTPGRMAEISELSPNLSAFSEHPENPKEVLAAQRVGHLSEVTRKLELHDSVAV